MLFFYKLKSFNSVISIINTSDLNKTVNYKLKIIITISDMIVKRLCCPYP